MDGRWYTYRTCFFGCRWAAYWFSRASSFLVRVLHCWVWLLPCGSMLMMVSYYSPLSLGVPSSWEKLQLGCAISRIGWDFHFSNATVCLIAAKRKEDTAFAVGLMVENGRVERKQVEQTIGLLLWYCGGAVWLKPWLRCLYHLLSKLLCVFRALSPVQLECMRGSLDASLRLKHMFPQWDLQQSWRQLRCAFSGRWPASDPAS